jgi:hypothetical protein
MIRALAPIHAPVWDLFLNYGRKAQRFGSFLDSFLRRLMLCAPMPSSLGRETGFGASAIAFTAEGFFSGIQQQLSPRSTNIACRL